MLTKLDRIKEMNKQQALKELEALRAKADALEAIINEPEPKATYGRERVDDGNFYWALNEITTVEEKRETTLGFGACHFKSGNYYHTKEEAEKARDRQLAYVRITDAIREQNKGWVPDWGDKNDGNYIFMMRPDSKVLEVDVWYNRIWLPNELYGTREAIKYVIKHHADDIKLYLGVE